MADAVAPEEITIELPAPTPRPRRQRRPVPQPTDEQVEPVDVAVEETEETE